MQFYFPIQILDLFDYKQFVSYVVQMWYKEINNNSELNIKKKVGNCTDYLLIFRVVCIEKSKSFVTSH